MAMHDNPWCDRNADGSARGEWAENYAWGVAVLAAIIGLMIWYFARG
jgi:hypothetical protein